MAIASRPQPGLPVTSRILAKIILMKFWQKLTISTKVNGQLAWYVDIGVYAESKQVWMYYNRSETERTLLHSTHRAYTACAFTRWQHRFAWNGVMAANLKLWRKTKKFDSVRRCMPYCITLRKEHSCQISSRSDLKRWSFGLFWRGRPNKKNNNTNKMSSDMRSVPDRFNGASISNVRSISKLLGVWLTRSRSATWPGL